MVLSAAHEGSTAFASVLTSPDKLAACNSAALYIITPGVWLLEYTE